jgi:hypothetical protein
MGPANSYRPFTSMLNVLTRPDGFNTNFEVKIQDSALKEFIARNFS